MDKGQKAQPTLKPDLAPLLFPDDQAEILSTSIGLASVARRLGRAALPSGRPRKDWRPVSGEGSSCFTHEWLRCRS